MEGAPFNFLWDESQVFVMAASRDGGALPPDSAATIACKYLLQEKSSGRKEVLYVFSPSCGAFQKQLVSHHSKQNAGVDRPWISNVLLICLFAFAQHCGVAKTFDTQGWHNQGDQMQWGTRVPIPLTIV